MGIYNFNFDLKNTNINYKNLNKHSNISENSSSITLIKNNDDTFTNYVDITSSSIKNNFNILNDNKNYNYINSNTSFNKSRIKQFLSSNRTLYYKNLFDEDNANNNYNKNDIEDKNNNNVEVIEDNSKLIISNNDKEKNFNNSYINTLVNKNCSSYIMIDNNFNTNAYHFKNNLKIVIIFANNMSQKELINMNELKYICNILYLDIINNNLYKYILNNNDKNIIDNFNVEDNGSNSIVNSNLRKINNNFIIASVSKLNNMYKLIIYLIDNISNEDFLKYCELSNIIIDKIELDSTNDNLCLEIKNYLINNFCLNNNIDNINSFYNLIFISYYFYNIYVLEYIVKAIIIFKLIPRDCLIEYVSLIFNFIFKIINNINNSDTLKNKTLNDVNLNIEFTSYYNSYIANINKIMFSFYFYCINLYSKDLLIHIKNDYEKLFKHDCNLIEEILQIYFNNFYNEINNNNNNYCKLLGDIIIKDSIFLITLNNENKSFNIKLLESLEKIKTNNKTYTQLVISKEYIMDYSSEVLIYKLFCTLYENYNLSLIINFYINNYLNKNDNKLDNLISKDSIKLTIEKKDENIFYIENLVNINNYLNLNNNHIFKNQCKLIVHYNHLKDELNIDLEFASKKSNYFHSYKNNSNLQLSLNQIIPIVNTILIELWVEDNDEYYNKNIFSFSNFSYNDENIFKYNIIKLNNFKSINKNSSHLNFIINFKRLEELIFLYNYLLSNLIKEDEFIINDLLTNIQCLNFNVFLLLIEVLILVSNNCSIEKSNKINLLIIKLINVWLDNNINNINNYIKLKNYDINYNINIVRLNKAIIFVNFSLLSYNEIQEFIIKYYILFKNNVKFIVILSKLIRFKIFEMLNIFSNKKFILNSIEDINKLIKLDDNKYNSISNNNIYNFCQNIFESIIFTAEKLSKFKIDKNLHFNKLYDNIMINNIDKTNIHKHVKCQNIDYNSKLSYKNNCNINKKYFGKLVRISNIKISYISNLQKSILKTNMIAKNTNFYIIKSSKDHSLCYKIVNNCDFYIKNNKKLNLIEIENNVAYSIINDPKKQIFKKYKLLVDHTTKFFFNLKSKNSDSKKQFSILSNRFSIESNLSNKKNSYNNFKIEKQDILIEKNYLNEVTSNSKSLVYANSSILNFSNDSLFKSNNSFENLNLNYINLKTKLKNLNISKNYLFEDKNRNLDYHNLRYNYFNLKTYNLNFVKRCNSFDTLENIVHNTKTVEENKKLNTKIKEKDLSNFISCKNSLTNFSFKLNCVKNEKNLDYKINNYYFSYQSIYNANKINIFKNRSKRSLINNFKNYQVSFSNSFTLNNNLINKLSKIIESNKLLNIISQSFSLNNSKLYNNKLLKDKFKIINIEPLNICKYTLKNEIIEKYIIVKIIQLNYISKIDNNKKINILTTQNITDQKILSSNTKDFLYKKALNKDIELNLNKLIFTIKNIHCLYIFKLLKKFLIKHNRIIKVSNDKNRIMYSSGNNLDNCLTSNKINESFISLNSLYSHDISDR